MKNERENFSEIKLSATDGVPNVSFTAPDANSLIPESFSISGNDLVAYYDASHKLIFVLDNTLDSRKPNVLLVINQINERKWDDILANDFKIDLETIRPKKDNKYQKLDIDYNGLSVYNRLINDFTTGNNLSDSLDELSKFRDASVRRSANERLIAANETISKTNETIVKTNETLNEHQVQAKKLREKLTKQKKQVGKEPTKQSAAKILKTESQIENNNEKIRRSKKRLNSAKRRLLAAEEDAAIARKILGQQEYKQINTEPKAELMAEEVKPLFDNDPEIMDEKIAFKPIEFNSVPQDTESEIAPVVAPAPLSFVPPINLEPVTIPEGRPVMETIKPAAPIPAPIPVQPAPVVNTPVQRPVSPGPEFSVQSNEKKRPTALYYIMLVVLIVLSIFTLWLYQKNTNDKVPDIKVTAQVNQPEVLKPNPKPEVIESPFIDTAPQVVTPVEVTEPVPEPVIVEPVYEEPQEPIYAEPEVVEEPAQLPEYNEEYYAPEPEPVPTEAPIRQVDKPEYGAGTNVQYDYSDQEYESDYDNDTYPADYSR